MKTKVIYVITSDEKDVYLEQTLLSVYSLKQKNPSAIVEIVVDSNTDSTLKGKRAEILKYVQKKIVVDVPTGYNKVQTSRYMKTSLRNYIEGDFLFIDSDTIIAESLDDIDDFNGEIGGVLNLHVPLELHSEYDAQKVRKRIRWTGYDLQEDIPYYNSGVMFVRECKNASDFYHMWHTIWKQTLEKTNIHKDQPPLASTNAQMGFIMKELGGEWNCQILNNGIPFLSSAKIIHYFASFSNRKADSPYLFCDNGIYEDIKRNGMISDSLAELASNAKGAFRIPCKVVVGNELDLLSNNLYTMAMHHEEVYRMFEIGAKCLLSIKK